ncbi:serine hydrolase [Streptococcus cuniculipharyngis]|uniref:Serine hydrolase n=1 Tax=Streptococcus cuniculipharyngis TaxID=1562651 RepID=A0A5C5SAX4_9STRE|nr:serine hydrolase [Streptococcus cuniculipharyngis]TWS97717.1 serine hydrolase [Streptococcus cuniculipharyngis]
MKKLLLLFILPVFLSPLILDSGEFDFPLTQGQRYQLSAQVGTLYSYFDHLPKNPSLYQETVVYADKNLKQVKAMISPADSLKIKSLSLNQNLTPVFELADGSYIAASKFLIFDDIVLEQVKVDQVYWTKEQLTLYESPYVFGVPAKTHQLKAYLPVKVVSQARTQHGTYLEIEGQGWVNQNDLSSLDNRIEKVQAMLEQKYKKANYGIYVKQLATQQVAEVNQDLEMYSASITKLPILYYVEEELQNAQFKLDDRLLYTEEVNQFKGAYDASGSSKLSLIADNKDYSVEELLKYVAQNSDNVASNLLGYYLTNQYDASYRRDIKRLAGRSWSMIDKKATAQMAGRVMEGLYYQNSPVLDYLSETEFDNQRISKDISVRVAHKIGDAYDYKHDVAIVYASSPFILSIFTDKASYDDITAIANDVYEILK